MSWLVWWREEEEESTWMATLAHMEVERRKTQGEGEMGKRRQAGGRSCPVNGNLRVEEKGREGVQKVKVT